MSLLQGSDQRSQEDPLSRTTQHPFLLLLAHPTLLAVLRKPASRGSYGLRFFRLFVFRSLPYGLGSVDRVEGGGCVVEVLGTVWFMRPQAEFEGHSTRK